MARDTGFPASDAENDFERLRRQQTLSRLASWMRREPDDVNLILPFDEVVEALGRTGERTPRPAGGPVGHHRGQRRPDPRLRPLLPADVEPCARARWQRLATAQRRGESVPPVQLWRVGGLHFVEDGHHRVSIAFAHAQRTIDAYVTEVLTRSPRTASSVAATCW